MSYLRRLPRFEYLGPASLAEACAMVAEAAGGEAMLLAGGTDAILQMRRRERTPRRVIGLKGVRELALVREQSDGGLALGAMTTLQTLLTEPLIGQRYDCLREAAAQIGGPELRNVATIGGNVAGALPCADLPPVFMTLGARIKLASARGERWLALEDFFPEFGRTAAVGGELVAEIGLPPPAPHGAGAYLKFHDRHSMDMTVLGVSVYVVRDPATGTVRDVRLAYANAAPVVFRAREAEAVLRGRPFGEEALEALAETACSAARPRTSWRASAEHRQRLIASLTKRALRRAWRKTFGEGAPS